MQKRVAADPGLSHCLQPSTHDPLDRAHMLGVAKRGLLRRTFNPKIAKRLAERNGAKHVTREVAEYAARAQPNVMASRAEIASHIRERLIPAIEEGFFDGRSDRGPDRAILWLDAEHGSRLQMTASAAASIILHDASKEWLADALGKCWMLPGAWHAWFRHLNLEPPAAWQEIDETPSQSGKPRKGRRPIFLDGVEVKEIVREKVSALMAYRGGFDASDGWNQAALERMIIAHLEKRGLPDPKESTVRAWIKPALKPFDTQGDQGQKG